MTVTIMTLGISIKCRLQNATMLSAVFFIVMLHAVMLSVNLLSVVLPGQYVRYSTRVGC
jgi:hypothetical protein